jgi:hypothetical protein
MVICISTFAQQYHLIAPFYIDDLEESVTNLNVVATTTNTSIIKTNTLSVLDSNNIRRLVFNVTPDSYGDMSVNIAVCDNGYASSHTAMIYASPTNTPTTNTMFSEYPLFLKTISYSNRVELQWQTNNFGNDITNIVSPLVFKINRFPTNSLESTKKFTAGYSSGTNFVDTNVVFGASYWYMVGWTLNSTSSSQSIMCTNMIALFKSVPSVPVQYTPLGFAFYGLKDKTYRISYKSNLTTDTNWVKIQDVNVTTNDLFIFGGPEYQNKIIYVTEVQQ